VPPFFDSLSLKMILAELPSSVDDEYRAGKANRNTARNFLHASIFFDVASMFSPLSEELKAIQKYAKWKAAEISAALRQGVTPTTTAAVSENHTASTSPSISLPLLQNHTDSVSPTPSSSVTQMPSVAASTTPPFSSNNNNTDNMSASNNSTTRLQKSQSSASTTEGGMASTTTTSLAQQQQQQPLSNIPEVPQPQFGDEDVLLPPANTNPPLSLPATPSVPTPSVSLQRQAQRFMPFPQDIPFVSAEQISTTTPMDDGTLTQEALQEYAKLEEEFVAQQLAQQTASSVPTTTNTPNLQQSTVPKSNRAVPPQISQQQQHTVVAPSQSQSQSQSRPQSQSQSIPPSVVKGKSAAQVPQQPLVPQLAAKSASNYMPSSVVLSTGYKPSEEDCLEAQKYAKYIVSSLQFDDVPAAISNLKKCFKLLTGQDIPFEP
jgi:hypothetical protein